MNELPHEIENVISGLRSRIRRYVWLEGLAVAIIWLGITFWVALGLDYLPVLAGSSEMPRIARISILVIVAAVLGFILYRWILRRAFVPLSRGSLALLVERQFPEFQDSLVTTIELSEKSKFNEQLNQNLLGNTRSEAQRQISSVSLSKIFDYRPLIRSVGIALLTIASIFTFGLTAKGAFQIWTSRLYLLSDEPWPRQAFIELLDFENKALKIAQGGDLTVRVRADATRPTPAPEVCTIVFRTDNGERGRIHMSKDGEPREGHQYYVFANSPFKGMFDSVTFDVIGFDHRLSNNRVEVVPSPTIVDVQLISEPPSYTKLLTRQESWSTASRLPFGSRITVRATANKPLQQIEVTEVGPREPLVEVLKPSVDSHQFDFQIENLRERFSKNIQLLDADGIAGQQPFRITVGVIEDQVPDVNVTLQGIGESITPIARIVTEGTAKDDYEIDSVWFEIDVADVDKPIQHPIDSLRTDKFSATLDLQLEQTKSEQFKFQPGQQLTLRIQARDHFDLDGTTHIGSSEPYTLQVVESSELLALLEANELELRRRFEQIHSEMLETRESLARVQSEATNQEPTQNVETDERKSVSLLSLRVQRARQQGDKSSAEIDGIVGAFEDIRQQLENNRIDSEERKSRIKARIMEPLRDIVDLMFPDWDDKLGDWVVEIDKNQMSGKTAQEAIQQTDDIIVAMEAILARMEELESYNELVDLVRSIITQQEELLEKTKQQRKKQGRSLLE